MLSLFIIRNSFGVTDYSDAKTFLQGQKFVVDVDLHTTMFLVKYCAKCHLHGIEIRV